MNPASENFSQEEILRYSRHLVLPELGIEGQRRLKNGSVLLIGAGGLGSPAALYLAAAGVGRIGLVDFDRVDLSNLQRQILHTTARVGTSKLDSARAAIAAINPHIKIETHETRINAANAFDLIRNYDVILDGTDNFPTRYLVNDACVLLGKPNVHGSVLRFDGQASIFWAPRGPCYRCLFPHPPAAGEIPNCAEGGVLGILPGIIGTLQATEAVKLLTGIGQPLIGRILLYDALKMKFGELKLQRDPACPVCGPKPTITTLQDFELTCEANLPANNTMNSPTEISPRELKQALDRKEPLVIVDVREPHELAICKLPGARHIPLGDFEQRYTELDPAADIVVLCRSGMRSGRAANFLRAHGFKTVRNITGGILAWSDQVDPTVPKY